MGKSSFSERTFEFCFNMDLAERFGGFLVSHPNLPSLKAERNLGYDVEFKIRNGEFTRSIFIQHKVPFFAQNRAGGNARFYDWYNGPYFRILIDARQHNNLINLAESSTTSKVFYCMPRFHLHSELQECYLNKNVFNRSLLSEVAEIGRIRDEDGHHLTYSRHGFPVVFHSRAQQVDGFVPDSGNLPTLVKSPITVDWIRDALTTLNSQPLLYDEAKTDVIGEFRMLLAKRYGVSWVILP